MGWNDANRGLRMKEERAYGKQALDAVDDLIEKIDSLQASVEKFEGRLDANESSLNRVLGQVEGLLNIK